MMADQAAGRILLITFPKCGSQWVRDVLFSEELAGANGVALGVSDHRLSGAWGIPDFEAGTISGPIYGASALKWREFARPCDKAVVLLRDPRDVAVSWMFAALYSHEPVRPLDTYRECLRAMSPPSRLLLAVDSVGRQHSEAFCSWAVRRSTSTIHVTTYERLLEGEAAFREIVDFLGWTVSGQALSDVLERLSFSRRSGRAPGEEDRRSYYRKATPGDWRNHFDRLSGRLLEVLLPGVVTQLGYETDDEWFEELAERVVSEPPGAGEPAAVAELEARLARAESQVERLQGIVDERQRVIDGMHREAEARLRVIDELRAALHRADARED
jgi:hypothetical protein